MQEKIRKSNKDRSDETRAKLVEAARALFIESGYAETGTPAIVKKAQVTRGALYHHFEDKAALLHAVLFEEAGKVANDITAADIDISTPLQSLLNGSAAYIQAMQAPGRTKLLLEVGPAILGSEQMRAIDNGAAHQELVAGLKAAMNDAETNDVEILAELLSAAFDRAAIGVASGGDAKKYLTAMNALIQSAIKS